MPININRLSAEIEELASYSAVPAPAVTRILYSAEDQAARAWLREKVIEAGLSIREDGLGNMYVTLEGSDSGLPSVATGSHIDAIPYSGKYDGVVGVLGGLEALRSIREQGLQPKRDIELILFTSEEPTRFGLGCLGSRAMAGNLSAADLAALTDADGNDLESLRKQAGFTQPLDKVQLSTVNYHAFVELHIEQGPRLERDKLDIGIVTSIAAPATLRVTLKGDGGHAGATLMPGRRDALVAASEIVLDVEKAAQDSGSPDSVATVGLMQVHPGAVNSIPSDVLMEIDIRDTQLATRDGMVARIQQTIADVCERRNIGVTVEVLNMDAPCQCGSQILETIESVTKDKGYSYKTLVSRAYHDALFMAQLCPTAMIFVPSENGYSHRPEEFTAAAEIEKGVEVLAETLCSLAMQ